MTLALRNTTLTLAILISATSLAQAQGPINWFGDLPSAQATAQQNQRLVLVHFWAESCPPCRRLEENVFKRARCWPRPGDQLRTGQDQRPSLW